MIIGKPITFGSGGLMAEIICSGDVTSTDTITCTNGLKSYSAIWVTDHFVISGLDLGTYTVTATRGSKSKSYDVLIDEIAVYEVEVSFKTYLYNLGDECESITGGWGKTGYYASGQTIDSPTKNSDNMYIVALGTYHWGVGGTINSISLTDHTKLCVDVATSDRIYLCIDTTKDLDNSEISSTSLLNLSRQVVETDISAITGGYINFQSISTSRTATVYKVWLE